MILHKSIFITGTGTDVGKTYIAAGICFQLASRLLDKKLSYIKPIATGVDTLNEDFEFIKKELASLNNFHCSSILEYIEPASPYISALAENKVIDYSQILKETNSLISQNDLSVIEGAGGLMVPITENKMMIDLMSDLKLPVIVVAHFDLGTVNHTLLTLDKLQEKDIPILGVVLNQPNQGDRELFSCAVKSNAHEIERVSGLEVLGQMEYDEDFESNNFKCIAEKILEQC
ncbi:MAG: dethiobiotin synthase [Planctomycetota bacterium]|nr:MAG: dethiobiotin synthase [Planctomycetota bacterium]